MQTMSLSHYLETGPNFWFSVFNFFFLSPFPVIHKYAIQG